MLFFNDVFNWVGIGGSPRCFINLINILMGIWTDLLHIIYLWYFSSGWKRSNPLSMILHVLYCACEECSEPCEECLWRVLWDGTLLLLFILYHLNLSKTFDHQGSCPLEQSVPRIGEPGPECSDSYVWHGHPIVLKQRSKILKAEGPQREGPQSWGPKGKAP